MAGVGHPNVETLNAASKPPSCSKTKQPCPSYTLQQWLEHRDRITNLYVEEELTLKQVRTILEEDHQFPATERQLKRKIKEWNLDKNIKDEEMRIILQYKQARNDHYGKDSIFYVRGRLVDYKKIQRFIQRKGSPSLSDLPDSSLPSLPEDIICQTPTDETPPSFMKIDVQDLTTIIGHESSQEGPEDSNSLIASKSSTNLTKQGESIEVDHAFLTDFWDSYWPNHTAGRDIQDFRFLDLPVQIPEPSDIFRLGGLQNRISPRDAGQVVGESVEVPPNKRRRVNTGQVNGEPVFPVTTSREDLSSTGQSGSTRNATTTEPITQNDLGAVLSELQAIRGQQDTLSSILTSLGQKDRDLKKAAEILDMQHTRHENSVNAIVLFLASVFRRSLESDEGMSLDMLFSDMGPDLHRG